MRRYFIIKRTDGHFLAIPSEEPREVIEFMKQIYNEDWEVLREITKEEYNEIIRG